jgi:hypothetical protein
MIRHGSPLINKIIELRVIAKIAKVNLYVAAQQMLQR